MMQNVSPAVRKFAAIGLALALVLLAINLVITPIASRLARVEHELEAMRAHVGQLIAVAQISREERAAGRQSEALISQTLYLPGESETIQLANLQARLLGIADKSGIRVQSSRTLTAIPVEGLQAVGMEMNLQSDIRRLQGLLHQIESHRPMLIVEKLSVAPSHGAIPAGLLAEGALQVNLRVLSLVHPNSGGQQ